MSGNMNRPEPDTQRQRASAIMRLFRLLRVVLWSFFGVRRGADAARDMEGVRPQMLLLAGVAVAAVLVIAIVTAVRLITGRPAPPLAPATQGPQPSTTTAPRPHGPVIVADTMEERMRPCTVCHGNVTQASGDGFSP